MQIPKEKIPKTVGVQVVRKIEQERNGTIAEAKKCEVICQADSDHADTLLRKLTAIVKIIKNRFVALKQPATETLRQIRQLEADILAPIEETKRGLDIKKRDWRATEQRKIAEAQAKADEKRREREALEEKHAKEHRSVPGPAPVIETPAPIEAVDVTPYRKSWEVEITDIWKVPNEYLVFNEPAIRANLRKAVQASKDDTGTPTIEIPDVNIFSKETPIYA